MNRQYPSRIRSRAKIIAAIADLPPAIQGKICEDRRKLANGKTVVYHNLQYWADGKNHTLHIPENKLDEFRAATKNGAKARKLIVELSCADATTILSNESPLKKNSRTSS